MDQKLTTASCYAIVEKNNLNPEIRFRESESRDLGFFKSASAIQNYSLSRNVTISIRSAVSVNHQNPHEKTQSLWYMLMTLALERQRQANLCELLAILFGRLASSKPFRKLKKKKCCVWLLRNHTKDCPLISICIFPPSTPPHPCACTHTCITHTYKHQLLNEFENISNLLTLNTPA